MVPVQCLDWTGGLFASWIDDLAGYQSAKATISKPFAQLTVEQQAPIESALKQEYRKGSAYNNGNGDFCLITRNPRCNKPQNTILTYMVIRPEFHKSRESFAHERKYLARFEQTWTFGMTSILDRLTRLQNAQAPDATYTNNWPHELLIGQYTQTAQKRDWSIASVVFLIAGVGFLIWDGLSYTMMKLK